MSLSIFWYRRRTDTRPCWKKTIKAKCIRFWTNKSIWELSITALNLILLSCGMLIDAGPSENLILVKTNQR